LHIPETSASPVAAKLQALVACAVGIAALTRGVDAAKEGSRKTALATVIATNSAATKEGL